MCMPNGHVLSLQLLCHSPPEPLVKLTVSDRDQEYVILIILDLLYFYLCGFHKY